jgi:hypothetical protein
MEGSEEGGQALKVNNGGERSPKKLMVQGGRRVFIGGENMAVGSSPPASSAVSPAAPASGPDGPAESPAGPDCSPGVRRPAGQIRRPAKRRFRIAVWLLRRTSPVCRRKVRPGARPGRTRGRTGQPKNQITFARKLRMR